MRVVAKRPDQQLDIGFRNLGLSVRQTPNQPRLQHILYCNVHWCCVGLATEHQAALNTVFHEALGVIEQSIAVRGPQELIATTKGRA